MIGVKDLPLRRQQEQVGIGDCPFAGPRQRHPSGSGSALHRISPDDSGHLVTHNALERVNDRPGKG
jgi:hypothetical protein